MGVFVKICGICSADDARMVASYEPDAIGFMFWASSKRAVRPEDVAPWAKELPTSIKRVGVFVSPTRKEVEDAHAIAGIDIAQVHGEAEHTLYEDAPLPLWQAVQLEATTASDAERRSVDAYLVDSYTPDSPGGTGKLSDWSLAANFVQASTKPVLLSGGLRPDNVASAIEHVQPWGVDVSSGVELQPGAKNESLVRQFIEACPR